MEKITFYPEEANGEAVSFFVLEQTRIGGVNYILVTEEEEGDSFCRRRSRKCLCHRGR